MEIYMSQEAVERLLGRLLTDDTFRKRAHASIEILCREGGYNLNAVELKSISHDDIIRIDMVSKQLDTSIKRFSGTEKRGNTSHE
jgi:hypothetical protein